MVKPKRRRRRRREKWKKPGKKEFNGMDIYIGERIYLWRNSQHERLWWQPEWFSPRPHLLLSLQSPSSWFSSRSDPLISLHPLLRSSVSSCTKPSVIPLLRKQLRTGIRSGPCPVIPITTTLSLTRIDEQIPTRQEQHTRFWPRQHPQPPRGLYEIFFQLSCPVFHRETD